MSGFRPRIASATVFLTITLLLFSMTSVEGFGVSFLACSLNVRCGTASAAVIGNLTVQKVFWPVVWTLSYLGGDPVDSTAYMTINTNTGVISRTGSYPLVFTQQVYKIDGIDASLSRNKVSAYVIIKLPQCNSG